MTDHVPWPDGEALGATSGGDGGKTNRREGQLVARNYARSAREVDSEGMAEGVRISSPIVVPRKAHKSDDNGGKHHL